MTLTGLAPFIVEFTKALLRTNYYAPEQELARRSVRGLFEAWRTAMTGGELQLSALRQPGRSSVLVSAPSVSEVPLNNVLGTETAELYEPKLLQFMAGADLVALAIGREVTEEELLTFLELMARPHEAAEDEVEHLDSQLWDRGVRHLTVLFNREVLGGSRKLSWATTLALSRLSKNLGRLNPASNGTLEEMRSRRAQVLADVLRPSISPGLMAEVLLNLDLVASPPGSALMADEVIPLLPVGLRLATALRLEPALAGEPTSSSRPLLMALCLASETEEASSEAVDLTERLIKKRVVAEEQVPATLRRQFHVQKLTEEWIHELDDKVAALSEGAPRDVEEATTVLSELLRRQRHVDASTVAFALSCGAAGARFALSAALTESVVSELVEAYHGAPLGDRRRRAALLSLLSRGDEKAIARLNEIIEQDVGMNPQALRTAFAHLNSQEVQDIVLRALEQDKISEAAATFFLPVAEQLGGITGEQVSRLVAHSSVKVRSLAVSTLATFGKASAENALAEALKDSDPEVGSLAIRALAILGSRRGDVVDAYRSMLLDRNGPTAIRIAAAEALGTLGDEHFDDGSSAETPLVECLSQLPAGLRGRFLPLNRRDEALYVSAIRSLERVGTRECLPMLEGASRCSSRFVRDAAQSAIDTVRARTTDQAISR